jgi:hypothetical protein
MLLCIESQDGVPAGDNLDKVEFREYSRSVEILYYVIHGGHNVAFTLNGDVGMAHINAYANVVSILLSDDYDRTDPGSGVSDGFDDVIGEHRSYLFFDFVTTVERNTAVGLSDERYRLINVELDLGVLHLSQPVE